MAITHKRAADSIEVKKTKRTKLYSDPHTATILVGRKGQGDLSKNANEENIKYGKVVEEQQDIINGNIHHSRQAMHQSPPHNKAKDGFLNNTNSREAHQKQKQLALERKAAKPNSDSIARTKKIWERLRIKSAVPKDEREKLVKELFGIISGRVKDFVFKHDSVRVIQCALKYATPAQKKQIAHELKGSYRELAESKYAKFLVAKLVVDDDEVRNAVVPEFYGHVKRLMRHPEASWIVDDIYRGIATKQQKAQMLREWYGPEFVLDAHAGTKSKGRSNDAIYPTADLNEILKQSPEKKAPIMQHLKEMTNQLVQKKTTGFTMLHDALLQYFINTNPGSPEMNEFLEMIKDDEEGDLVKNLAFTKSGSRIVCLALAYGTSKDRRTLLKFFKTHVKLLSGDLHGHLVLLTAFEVIDDTVMTSKAIFPELLSKDLGEDDRSSELMRQIMHLTARIPILYLLAPEPPKWLLTVEGTAIIGEVKDIRATTSKKDPNTRRTELLKAISPQLLDFVALHAAVLAESSFGSQFVTEAIIGGIGDKTAALAAITALATPATVEGEQLLNTSHAGRMFKTLAQGGRFNQGTKSIDFADPPLRFHDLLYQRLRDANAILGWATGPNAFTIAAMLEAPDFQHQTELQELLRQNRKLLQESPSDDRAAHAGSKLLLDKIGAGDEPQTETKSVTKKSKKAK